MLRASTKASQLTSAGRTLVRIRSPHFSTAAPDMVEDKIEQQNGASLTPPLPNLDDYLVLITHVVEKRDKAFSLAWRDDLRRAGVNAVMLSEQPPPERVRYAVCFDPTPGVLASFPNLRAAHSMGAGITNSMLEDEVIPHRLPLLRMTDPGMARRMATFCLWAVINCQRKCDGYYKAQQASRWDTTVENHIIRDNETLRVGIMGLGNLGTVTAELFLAAGYPVSAWTRSPRAEEDRLSGVEYYSGPGELGDFTKGLDAVICLLPITKETMGILNADLFNAMNHGASVINVGRGEHLVEEDLLHALESGQLGAAVLDVHTQEPLPSSSLLWQHPKVRVMPHISSWTQRPGAVRLIARNFKALDAGETLKPNQYIERKRGY